MRPLLWIPVVIYGLATLVNGFVIVLWLTLTNQIVTRESLFWPGRQITAWKPKWAWVYGNEEDGVEGAAWWQAAKAKWPKWLRTYWWSAIRNPVNNDRFVYPLGIIIDPAKIKSWGNVTDSPQDDEAREQTLRFRWCYTVQGPFSGFWARVPVWKQRYFNIRCGWKLLPKDARGVPDYDYRKPGCGFGLQFPLRTSAYPRVKNESGRAA